MVIENSETSALDAPPDHQSFSSPLPDHLQMLYAPIAEHLRQAELILEKELQTGSPFVAELTRRVQLYRGKKLRPALLLLVAKACGHVSPEHHILAAVVEMIHAATLIHDDVLDEAQIRRHVTTVNAEWGNEASVLLGDFLFTHSFHLAASTGSAEACRLIGHATNVVCEGELHQISRRGSFDLTENEYLEIIGGKTAELLACCGRLGARFAGSDERVQEAMAQFGRSLGVAFQIGDDLLDLLSTENQAGKSLGSDFLKQKPTLPMIRFREVASATMVDRCREIFENASADQHGQFLALLAETDALEYTRRRAGDFAEHALDQLHVLGESPATQVLRRLPRLVIDRAA